MLPSRYLRNVPMSYMWLLRRLMGAPNTVLDVGCGDGELMATIAWPHWEITGIEIYPPSVEKARDTGIYKRVIQGDLVQTCRQLIEQGITYDVVFCSQVIEHITRQQGEELLGLVDRLARDRIYVGTPRGFMNQPEVFIQGSPYQVHKSGWSPEDFRVRGYRVYGIGFYPAWSEQGLARGSNTWVTASANLMSYIVSPITFMFPKLAAGIMAIKHQPTEGRPSL